MKRGYRHCRRYRFGLSGKDLVVAVYQLDQHVLLALPPAAYVDCADIARVRPMPGQVVECYVQMAGSWRYVESADDSLGLVERSWLFHPVPSIF